MPSNITNDIDTLTVFNKIFELSVDSKIVKIELDFENVRFIRGELIVLIGAMKHILEYKSKSLVISNVRDSIKRIIGAHDIFAEIPHSDNVDTAIHFKNFKEDLNNGNNDCFDVYTKNELEKNLNLKKPDVDYIMRYLSELFVNAVKHSRTKNIYCCGQRYPNIGRVRFTILDLGDSIPTVVEKYKEYYFKDNDVASIIWALKKGNTTKKELFGGLGLSDIEDFLKINHGNLTIVSRFGYYNNTDGNIIKRNTLTPFNGTLIIIDVKDIIYNIDKIFKTINKPFSIEF